MNKIIVIGSPGSGKSTFARKLQQKTNLPLYYLDMLFHNADKSTVSKEEFDTKLQEIVESDSWIIDGNYQRTLPMRFEAAEQIFFFDLPLDVCLAGAEFRIGKKREDMPWVEEEFDSDFRKYIIDFPKDQLPLINDLVEQYKNTKDIIIFKSHQEANAYLHNLCSRNTFKIVYKDIILRDMVNSDIEDDIHWNTIETEWALWDAPWEMEDVIANFDSEEYRKKEEQRIINSKDRRLDDFRWQLELDYIYGTHIGSVNTYCIDENYEWISYERISKGDYEGTYYYALGIEINEPSFWNKGIGKQALAAYIKYHISHNHLNLALQTWSGNIRMINCAQHIGFKEVNREKDFRLVRGEHYDGLTFLLDIDLFNSIEEQY